MIRTMANSPGLLLAVFIAALALQVLQVSTGIITASKSITEHEEWANQVEIFKKELLPLENLTRLHHDQQMKRWDPLLMADGDTAWPCPDATSISPCACNTSGPPSYNFDIDCSAVTGDDDIIDAFAVLFPFDDIGRLLIDGVDSSHKVPITSFTQNMFNTKSFSVITVRDTTLERIEDSVFQLSQSTLISLSLQRNNLQLFPFEIIQQYPVLSYIHMPYNDILELPRIQSDSLRDINMNYNHNLVLLDEENTFVDTPSLRTVRLASTSITRIPPNLFSSLHSIANIYISSNSITELEANAINAPSNTIKMLYLADNSISTVRVGAITGMASGGKIDLTDNQISTLEQEVWEDVLMQLDTDEALILDGNPLLCGCDMSWIVRDADHKRKLSPETRCFTGDLVSALQVGFFNAHCEQP